MIDGRVPRVLMIPRSAGQGAWLKERARSTQNMRSQHILMAYFKPSSTTAAFRYQYGCYIVEAGVVHGAR